jgi:hypothetical protein
MQRVSKDGQIQVRGHGSRRVALSAFTRVLTRYGDAPHHEVELGEQN